MLKSESVGTLLTTWKKDGLWRVEGLVGYYEALQVPPGTVAFLIVTDDDAIQSAEIRQVAEENVSLSPGEVVWGVLEHNLPRALLETKSKGRNTFTCGGCTSRRSGSSEPTSISPTFLSP